MTVLYKKNVHNNFEVGIIDSPLFHLDAVNIKDEIYSLGWFLPSYLIKDSDYDTIIENYNTLIKKYDENESILMLQKKNNKYYLYVLFNRNIDNLNHYEAIGLFQTTGKLIHKEITDVKNKIKKTSD